MRRAASRYGQLATGLANSHPTQWPVRCVLLVLNAHVLCQAMEVERHAVFDMDVESEGALVMLCLQQHTCA